MKMTTARRRSTKNETLTDVFCLDGVYCVLCIDVRMLYLIFRLPIVSSDVEFLFA